jgi:hypothetical protein
MNQVVTNPDLIRLAIALQGAARHIQPQAATA